jgi:hypothetical protein
MSELTSMQAACWFGRITESGFLGGVAAHLYVEFDGQSIDVQKLESALQRLYLEHDILRMRLSLDGIPAIASSVPKTLLEVEDLRALSNQEQAQYLDHKREQWTHQQLDLIVGQTARFSISLLNEASFRLHIDTDMIAIDPSSFCRLIEDLALFYEEVKAPFAFVPSFFDWHERVGSDVRLKQLRYRDRVWWKSRLPDIAPMPVLPLSDTTSKTAQSHRLSEHLTSDDCQSLQHLARRQKITFSSMMLGLFAYTLSHAAQTSFFRLNVPVFWREPLIKNTERCIGDFANFVILNVDTQIPQNLAELCQGIASQMMDLLAHSHYAGVNIMRDLSRYHGDAQLAPVVFTAALDLPQGTLFSENVKRAFGAMNWTISQGPQVALDAQVVRVEDGLLINWDMRLDALPIEWVSALFQMFVSLLREVSKNPTVLEMDFDKIPSVISHKKVNKSVDSHELVITKKPCEQPLSAIQQAYLLGRTTQLPLGGVAMQEFREYYGSMDMALLKQRLTEIVKRYDSLRTHIDATKLRQFVSDDIVLNLTEIDLSEVSPQAASVDIQSYRGTYTHQIFDLNQSPWDITIFQLRDGFLRVFVRFDALILDGRSIAAIIIELFEGRLIERDTTENPPTESDSTSKSDSRTADMAYWVQKLSCVTKRAIPDFPWIKPLDRLGVSRFERKSLVVPADMFHQLSKIGARQGLFKNTIIMSVILELLSHLYTEPSIQVAVPVLPLYSGSFSNHSTFIAIKWQASSATFADRASTLQADILEGLQHLCFSGVDLARLLFEKSGTAPVLPIVITNGLSWPVLADANPMSLEGGLTQTPQVAIDIRFSTQHDCALVFDIDYVPSAIAAADISAFLKAMDQAIHQIVASKTFALEVATYLPINAKDARNRQSIDHQSVCKGTGICQDALLNIYLDTIHVSRSQSKNQPPTESVNKTMNFISMGLRPHHLKTISKRLYAIYCVELSLEQLLRCRNVSEVEKLLQTSEPNIEHLAVLQ